LFKKVALANYLALYVDRVYDNPGSYSATALVLATVAFAWQIFFDFSGYTDMARGVAKLMGFNLILNFNNPYLATGLGDFWSRWHISLSSWFRDYVYIPLGGNRKGALLTYRNLFITFLVSGIWHGAAWTFAIWGILHAAGVIITRELERSPFYRERVPKLIKQLAVFAFVCFAWIFFRAESLSDAWLIIGRIATAAWRNPEIPALMIVLVLVVWLYQFAYESRFRDWLRASPVRVGLAVCMVLYMCLFSAGGGAFIYFQF
jgi:alginate O-acetyltransferase complex protein AlgI